MNESYAAPFADPECEERGASCNLSIPSEGSGFESFDRHHRVGFEQTILQRPGKKRIERPTIEIHRLGARSARTVTKKLRISSAVMSLKKGRAFPGFKKAQESRIL